MNKKKQRRILLNRAAAVILLAVLAVLLTSCAGLRFPWQKESSTAEGSGSTEIASMSESTGTENKSDGAVDTEPDSDAETEADSETGSNTEPEENSELNGNAEATADPDPSGSAEAVADPESGSSAAVAGNSESNGNNSEPSGNTEASVTPDSDDNTETASKTETTATAEAAADITTNTETADSGSFSGSEEEGTVYPPCPPRTWLERLEIPPFTRAPFIAVHDNIPFFDTESLTPESYEVYYDLDELGRCTLADAVVGQDLQPTEKRGNISMVKPTGWHTDRYSFVNGEMLYNRCHLIAYYLTAENANTRNLVTGTSFMNRDGMNLFENLVGDYVKESGNHVRYRVTPVFRGENLICDGVLMEGFSIEDGGEDICFCVFAYNVQPGVHIDYLTGDNYADGEPETDAKRPDGTYETESEDTIGTYVLNLRTKKIHRPECPGIVNMSEKNRKDYTGSRNALLLDGYVPCPACRP